MRSALILLYGVLCYAVFLLTFLYAITFVADVTFVPHTVNRGFATASLSQTVMIDAVLLGIFAVQHSGMARRGFKKWLAGWMSPSIERSTYVLISSLVLILLFWQWRPLPGVVWDAGRGWAWWLLYAVSALGWLIVLSSTFIINHFDLFGLRQVWLRARNVGYTPPEFVDSFFYRVVRHPLMLGFVIAFWSIPRMTTGHLLFASLMTLYTFLGIDLEERKMLEFDGPGYQAYIKQVPQIIPLPR